MHDVPAPPPLGSAGVETLTWVIELGVGLACLAIGVLTRRNSRLRIAGIALLVAGVAATGHALVRLLSL